MNYERASLALATLAAIAVEVILSGILVASAPQPVCHNEQGVKWCEWK